MIFVVALILLFLEACFVDGVRTEKIESLMKLVKYLQARKKSNSEFCSVWEYQFAREHVGFATAHINGRYPAAEGSRALNEACDHIYFVLSGSATVHCVDGDFFIECGDALFLERNKWYWVEGNDLMIAVVSTPDWVLGQHKIITDYSL